MARMHVRPCNISKTVQTIYAFIVLTLQQNEKYGNCTFFYRDLKVIILGPASVGKTCFMQRYMTGEFNDKYVPVSI